MRVEAFPRIHITLCDLGNATQRRYGGCGFLIDGLQTVLEASSSTTFSFDAVQPMDAHWTEQVNTLVENLNKLAPFPRVEVLLRSTAPQHVGLGASTTTLLAVIKLWSLLTGFRVERTEAVRISGRGGTSGIGVNAFFEGGVIFDGGHGRQSTDGEYRPSSAQPAGEGPPVITRVPWPDNWEVDLVLPPGTRHHGDVEMQFFKQNTPIPTEEVNQVIAACYHGLVPGFQSADIRAVRESLQVIQWTGFKAREIGNQPAVVRETLEALLDGPEIAAGMSSMGPLLYAIRSREDEAAFRHARDVAASLRARVLGHFTGRNAGHSHSS